MSGSLALPLYCRVLRWWCLLAGHYYPVSRVLMAGDYLVSTCRCGARIWNDVRDYPAGAAISYDAKTGTCPHYPGYEE